MLNNQIDNNTSWGVSYNYDKTRVLVQLSDNIRLSVIRVVLTQSQAEQFLEKLKFSIDVIKDWSQE